MPNGRGGSGAYGVNMQNRETGVNHFFYTNDILDELEAAFSSERLATYLHATQGDRGKAIRLHIWNTGVSAAFYGPLQGLEVTFRNAMHRKLADLYGNTWYDNSKAGLDRGALDRISGAKNELAREGCLDDPHRIVAVLSFGFWVSLLGPGGRRVDGRKANYQMSLWRPALRGAFAHCAKLNRKQAHGPLNALRTLRNRIAHHEPIFSRNLARDHERILEVAGWISPATQEWIKHHSRVPWILGMPRNGGALLF